MQDRPSLPETVGNMLIEKGVDLEKVRLFFCSDQDASGVLCESYVIVTDEDLVVLSVREELKASGSTFVVFRRRSVPVTTQLDCRRYDFGPEDRLLVEETRNGGRLFLAPAQGDAHTLCRLSMARRNAAKDFCREAMRRQQGTEAPAPQHRQAPGEKLCPKCHRPYPDPRTKICPYCMPKNKLFFRLFPFFKRYRLGIAVTVLMLFIGMLLSLLGPYLSNSVLYDRVLKPGNSLYGQLGLLVLAVVLTNLLMALFDHLNSVVSSRISANVVYDLKKTIFENLQRLSMGFFSGRQTGSLMTQVNGDAETLYWFFCDGVPFFITNAIKLLGVCVALLLLDWRLALLVFLPMPAWFLMYRGISRGFSRLHAKNFALSRRFNSSVSDALTGFRVVKAFAKEDQEVDRFHRQSTQYANSHLAVTLRGNRIFPVINYGITLIVLALWAVGGWLVVRHSVTGGAEGVSYATLMLFLSYMSYVSGPVSFFNQFIQMLSRAANAMRRLFEVMDSVPEVEEDPDPIHCQQLKGEIAFDRVGFSYEAGHKTLEDVSFSLEAGKTLGIVGHTGAGKSTLANLLTRLYDAEEGSITLDGQDIRRYSFSCLHENVAIVSQETYLFRGSVMDNIRYACPRASREQVIAAAKAAGAHDFIMQMPHGYNTVIGSSKNQLSGGERQRISIARAVLKKPRILILDEATAAMDTATERQIQESLDRITKDRTTVIIAHRLSTLKNADQLIVIHEGKMIEAGTHHQLMQQKGQYYKLYMLQLEALKTIAVG